ncbi:MAG: sigma-70 family RNA polymerase sigma factor [Bryobacteraceae bacterium]|nr:sigma-70 family RNA polymerase sigma factor [Bryobacteraceae bacterium]
MDRQDSLDQFDAYFHMWYPHLLRYTCRFTASRATAEDVTQEVFLDLYEALRSGHRIEFPKAWTLCVARRKCADLQTRPFNLDGHHESLDVLEDRGSNPVQAMHASLEAQRLRSHLALLTEREEEVLLLRLQSMKFREIGESLGITTSSVNTLLSRALDKLQLAFGTRRVAAVAAERNGL